MKFTPAQKEDMKQLRDKAKSLIQKYSSRSMKNLQFDLLNFKEENSPSLVEFKVSFAWIGKIKKECGKARSKNIVNEETEKKLLQWGIFIFTPPQNTYREDFFRLFSKTAKLCHFNVP